MLILVGYLFTKREQYHLTVILEDDEVIDESQSSAEEGRHWLKVIVLEC